MALIMILNWIMFLSLPMPRSWSLIWGMTLVMILNAYASGYEIALVKEFDPVSASGATSAFEPVSDNDTMPLILLLKLRLYMPLPLIMVTLQ